MDTEQDRVILIRTVVQFMATKVSLLTSTIVKLVVSNTCKACALLTLVKLVVTNPRKTWKLWLLCLLLDESGWKYLRCYILPEIRHIKNQAHIKLNPKKLYQSDGYSVKELLKVRSWNINCCNCQNHQQMTITMVSFQNGCAGDLRSLLSHEKQQCQRRRQWGEFLLFCYLDFRKDGIKIKIIFAKMG